MDFLDRHKKIIFIFLVVLAIAAMIFTLNYKKPTFLENLVGYVVAPTQEVTGNIGDWITEKIDLISNLNELEGDNEKLREELEILLLETSRLDMLEKEVEELRTLIDLGEKFPDIDTIGAQVIARDNNNWSSKFLINVGTRDGIYENHILLAQGGLVGKVSKAGYNYAQITPITDDTSSVGAMSKRTDDQGFVKGDLTLSSSGYCRMDNIDLNAQILENDEIVTSNLGTIYPPGITIGHVREVHVDPSGLTKYAVIEPAVDFKHLQTVLVAQNSYEKILYDNPPLSGELDGADEPIVID